MADIISIPAHRLAALIRLGELSPVEVVEAFLDRACAWSPKLNAFSDLYVDEARAAARDAHRALAAGVSVGPLHGVPIALKDAFDVAGSLMVATDAYLDCGTTPNATMKGVQKFTFDTGVRVPPQVLFVMQTNPEIFTVGTPGRIAFVKKAIIPAGRLQAVGMQ